MNLISKEHEAAKAEEFRLIDKTGLVALTPANVAKVEAMIRIDSAYRKSMDKNAGPKKGYDGSTAYWMTELKKLLIDRGIASGREYEAVVSEAVRAVDRENGTHLNVDRVGPDELLDRILELRERLVYYLRNPKSTDYWLVKRLSERTHPTEKGYRSRENLSFASKFCHYACFYLFEDEPEQDNYSIYDNVVRKVLPKYAQHYEAAEGITAAKLEKNYVLYQATIDQIIAKSGKMISRNGFDHLLWYCFK